jgi:hypothetical protein
MSEAPVALHVERLTTYEVMTGVICKLGQVYVARREVTAFIPHLDVTNEPSQARLFANVVEAREHVRAWERAPVEALRHLGEGSVDEALRRLAQPEFKVARYLLEVVG